MEPTKVNPRTKRSDIKFSGAVQVRGMIRRVWRHRYLEIDYDGVLRYYEAVKPICSGGIGSSKKKSQDQMFEREMQAFTIPPHLTRETVEQVGNRELSDSVQNHESSYVGDYISNTSETCYSDDGDHVFVEPPKRNNIGHESLETWDDIKMPEVGALFKDSREQYSTTGISSDRPVEVCITSELQAGQPSSKQSGLTTTQNITCMDSTSEGGQQLIQTPHHRIHDHRPKAVMTILSARLIDVTTLRDIHVGLPKGKHGFVFCGRQIFTETQSVLYDSTVNADHILDSQSLSGDDFEINGDICHPLSILNVSDHYFDTSRDYLCSVSTEEEAKSWVAALKWASKVSSRNKQCEKQSLLKCGQNLQSPMISIRGDFSSTMNQNLGQKAVNSSQDMLSSLVSDSSTVLTDSGVPHGYTIVAKVKKVSVTQPQWVRLIGIKCEVTFDIRLLLLGPNHLLHRSMKRTGDENYSSAWEIEQRTISRTFQEIMALASSFTSKTDANSTLLNVVTSMRNLNFANIIGIKQNVTKSIEYVDTVLRMITSDPQVCDEIAVKQFLGLTSRPPVYETLHVAIGQSIDEFVKKWLLAQEERLDAPDKLRLYAMLLLRSPVVESILSAKLVYVAKYALKFWWTNPCILHIRADALLTLCSGMFYLGYNMGSAKIGKESKDVVVEEKEMLTRVTEDPKKICTAPVEDVTIHEEHSLYDSLSTSEDSHVLSSPLPIYPNNGALSCWSSPNHKIFNVRGKTYLKDRIKHPSGPSPFKCRGVDMWLTDNPERNISRLPCVLGGKLAEEDTFLVNFLLPFGNFVMYFSVSDDMPENVANVWKKFKSGDQLYRDSRLKLLPVVVEGPWIVKKAVGNGTAPALLSQSIPLQYYFTMGEKNKKDIFEVDVIISASRIAKGILNVVKSHTNKLTIALGIIIEATTEADLPEVVLCSSQLHSLDLEHCPHLPKYFLEDESLDD